MHIHWYAHTEVHAHIHKGAMQFLHRLVPQLAFLELDAV